MNIEEINQVDSLGRNHGLWRYTSADSSLAIYGYYSHGLRHGLWRYLEDDNKLIWAEYYVNGKLEGESVTFLNYGVSFEHEEPNNVRQIQRLIILCQ